MEREQIKEVIAKYKKMSNQFLRYGEDKCYEYGSIAEAIEENFEEYLDDYYESEEDVLEGVKEELSSYEATLDMMFDRDDDFNDDDDGIGSFLSK